MNILIITFDLGLTSSGISTDRVAEELANSGHCVSVITAMAKERERPFSVFRASPFPLKPARLLGALGNYFRRDLNYYFWERRAIRLGLNLISTNPPDVIYARGSPACSFTVGFRLSKRTSVPLAIHFADPIPATPDWQPLPAVREKMTRTVLPALKQASLATFVNKRMMKYQEYTSRLDVYSKAAIVPNPIPFNKNYGAPQESPFVFAFLGSFFGSRKPDSLLSAFAAVARRNPSALLHIYGVWTESLNKIIESDEVLTRNVRLNGWTSDISSVFKSSSCLIDVDADVEDAVYTSNKLMEYMAVDRPILLISPVGSASRELVNDLKITCATATHDIDDIESAMERILSFRWGVDTFDERASIRREMSLDRICGSLVSHLEIASTSAKKSIV